MAGSDRQTLLESELRRYVDILATRVKPERVIAFGSLVSGEPHAASDIDLVVITRTALPFWKRLREMRRILQPRVSTDLLVYTPEEFETLRQERAFVRDEIAGKGRVVYEQGR